MSELGGQGLGEGTASPNDNVGQESSTPVGENNQPQGESYNHPFLDNIPDEEKPIVGKYIKSWDAGVQRRFMELHQQFDPYKQLGDLETLQKAQQFYDYFQRNPQDVYQRLQVAFSQQQQQQNPQLQQNGQGLNGYPEDVAPYFQQFDQRFNQFQQFQSQTTQVLEALANYVMQGQQEKVHAQEDAELNRYMGFLKDEFGDFDEEYVLSLMHTGISGEQAVQRYQQAIQSQVNNMRAPEMGAPVLSGGGGTPPSAKSVTDLDRHETRNLVANVLAQAAQQRG